MRIMGLICLLASILFNACAQTNPTAPAEYNAHPEAWLTGHGVEISDSSDFTKCTVCHGADLAGSEVVPGCFTAVVGCHHPVDGSYLSGSVHGPDAKLDLTACQACHGEAGGPGDNPRFNGGISGISCENCHGINLAHPENWAGPDTTFHYSVGSTESCALCHGADLSGGAVGPSCLACHDSAAAFTLDCGACHEYPPNGSLHAGTVTGVYHLQVPLSYHGECTLCHGMSESATGGGFEPTANYTLFDQATDTIGDHWDGNLQMNAYTQYDEDNHVCGNCHDYDPYYMLSDSGLPIVLKDML